MLGILIGLVLLMVLAYFGWSIIWLAPLIAGVVAFLNGMNILDTYTGEYMQGFVDFTKAWFPVFMLGAIFGKVMDDTGAAKSVAMWITKVIGKKRAILGVLIASAVLTYGGVSLFVVVFAVYPITLALFKEANISRTLIPPTLVLGAFTFTMTAVPGSPQIQNLIPMNYFKTTPMAAPIIGIVASLIMALGGYFYLAYRQKKLEEQGIGYVEPEEKAENEEKDTEEKEVSTPNPFLSFLPLIVIVILLNAFHIDIIISMIVGILLTMILNPKKVKGFLGSINAGAKGAVVAIINTAAAVGFGAVVKAVPDFSKITDMLMGIKGSPLISEALTTQLMAGVTGSASGGMGIVLEALGSQYYDLAIASGINLEAFHRIASVASGALILPHNGALLTLLAVTGITHKESYKDVFVIGVIIPTIATVVGIVLATIGII
ncbi:H+/gluconate symporter-like permease [Bacillus ectoiniformans]|uniref:GntP family permease n=1 Tax=Bacillus ectoiniformans TaxID=1494429 RepID=UPI00195AFFDB|nr:GntP family permease [Bacillus ectoiniformans]MBM7648211.1 H+/gluconate symporter-like permease [Bacillus ectoiniformans]